MRNLPTFVYSAEQLRQLDRDAIERLGISGYTLMTRAGAAALRILRKRWPDAKRLAIVCGPGNNGGDGYVLARLAMQAGLIVTTIALSDPNSLRGDALKAYRDFADLGGRAVAWAAEFVRDAELIVDAIFGIGLSRPVDAGTCACINAMNASAAPILALDIPSGLHADSGLVLGAAIKADCTVAFIGLKLGFYVGVAADYIGDLEFDSLEVPASEAPAAGMRVDSKWLSSVLPPRSRLAHKGSNGRVLLVGGGPGMAGAVRLAGEACLRVGAGLVTIATCAENVASIVAERPELIVRGIASAGDLEPLIEQADVVAVGPGLGQDAWAVSLWNAVRETGKPLVVDADALNLLAKQPMRNERWILTPHPGEAGRLLGFTAGDVQADRASAARSLVQRYDGTVVLKGANTLVACKEQPLSICDQGNPAMATAGMGDVLTGVVAGLLAQFDDFRFAACAGAVAHAWAGDSAKEALGNVERGLLASDLFAFLPRCVSADE